ncbi:hypothetical protein [Planococcus citreus]|uniref:DUF2326 domain-containing protein n=1 Tax=Planococcus citreus TaxID=1373 RepID=A0A497YLR6_9BACL|nr:hypothetical protein [Planococcus citreus]RLJ81342.1 hypothetical protein DFR62_3387 [Planococcus citreus]
MNKLIVRTIYLFEPKNKMAKRIDFEEGINVITSDKRTGNDVGKSILLKSIYHTLGADSIFDHQWTALSKIYILHISINQAFYYIYRSESLFKIFDDDFNKIFETINRSDLAVFFKDLFGFTIVLPNKNTEEIEIASPVYSYLLNYVDQDKMDGPKFNSFSSLYQYKNDKKAILYNHFGIFTEEYFETVEKIEKLKREEKNLNAENTVFENMLERVKSYLQGLDAPTDMDALRIEIEESKKEYTAIFSDLKKYKNKLMILRNERIQLEIDITELKKWKKMKEKDVALINEHLCPTCSQELESENTKLKITQNSQLEDFYIMKNELDSLLLDIKRQLEMNENHYEQLLTKLSQFEAEMNTSNNQISDTLKHRGYLETRDNMLQEFGEIQEKLSVNKKQITENKKILKRYDDLKKIANERYEQLMNESVDLFGLEEIQRDKLKGIDGSFNARGSNISITTIIWFYNLLKVKYELNPDAIHFPVVLDSPNNVELEDDKLQALFDFIFNNVNTGTQLIVSTLGFDPKTHPDVEFDNIINLETRKYHLLNEKDFEENKEILNVIFNKN